jgi:hypothetical protein
MQQVVDNPTLARAVGRRGQQVGEKHFDYRANGVEMMSFLNQLSKLNRKSAY